MSSKIVAYYFTNKVGFHYFEKMEMSDGRIEFLAPVVKGELSYYRKVKESTTVIPLGPNMTSTTINTPNGPATISTPSASPNNIVSKNSSFIDYLCKDGLGCEKLSYLGFMQTFEKYVEGCDIYFKGYKKNEVKLLVEEYNNKCGESGIQKDEKK